MKTLILILVTFLWGIQFLSAQKLSTKDSTQLALMIDDWNRAWIDKDHVLACRWYSRDARFTNAFGDKRKGQNEVEALLKEVFALPFVMSGQSETTEHQYQVLDDKNVIIHSAVVRKGQKMPDGSIIPDRQTSHMRAFQRGKAGWEIIAHLISDARDKQNARH